MRRSKEVKEGIEAFFLYWMPFFGYLSVIFYISHQSDPAGGFTLPVSDKIIHCIEFLLLPFFTIRAFRRCPAEKIRRNFLLFTIIFSLLYAASDEFHQWFIPNRQCSFFDLIADYFGIGIGAFIFRNNTL
ncbi:MAG: VanZ family protein [Candidatus Omnitrophica bacterium]|nr:VanZ family protein [Candidatus Omnitrophota bacterium]